eukprot:13713535-Alexandrium_andersonii.AAC.1
MEGPSELAFQVPILQHRHLSLSNVHSPFGHMVCSMRESAAPSCDASAMLPPPPGWWGEARAWGSGLQPEEL